MASAAAVRHSLPSLTQDKRRSAAKWRALDVTWNRVILVCRQQHVLGDVDLDAMAFTNRDRRRNVDELVEHVRARLREAGSDAGFISFTARDVVSGIVVCGVGCARDNPQRDGRTEYLEVVAVGLVFQAGISDLVETVELVEINGVAIR